MFDAGIFYEILKVRKGNQKLSSEDLIFGPLLRKEKSKVFIDKWNKQLEHLEHIINKNSDSSKLNEIKEMISLIKSEIQ